MSNVPVYPRLSRFKTAAAFRERLEELGLDLPLDARILTAAEHSPLAQPIGIFGKIIGNRWCIHPMEGWDGTEAGLPTEYTRRRWRRFGESGAKLIFGGEATAVRQDGRSSPNQIMAAEHTKGGLAALLHAVKATHREMYGNTDDLLVGLQLTHSGRFSKPNHRDRWEPRIVYHHPILDEKFGIDPHDDSVVLSDDEIEEIIACYVQAAKIAYDVGFDFVDVKHCHGYLAHEFLSAYTRKGKYGGSFENRTRFLRTIVDGIRSATPNLHIAVRLSAFDLIPFHDDEQTREGNKKGIGIPHSFEHCLPYRYGFGTNAADPMRYDLTETFQFIQLLRDLAIPLVNVSCGSPYYNPHIQRPAYFPPSDGYRPPEDPLIGVIRQIEVTRAIKKRFPDQIIIGTGYTYLQEFLPLVAQAVVREGWADIVGIGRMALVYPQMPADCLTKGSLQTKLICRTFSDCTTAPRHRMISGCYPLDEFYKELPEAERVKEVKRIGGRG
ncbi:MAG: NADH:flavin oxidoreductase [Candidatus Omnitrophota bacterium]|jgi:2,4-dienoyl-CoA reductase-like NADH-dependent reductase (Old Yellow Enzyme family)|nr:MAG: NADH:flavin oxidoreductase [Candidatus Omnitrophota bacterium]